MKKAFLIAMFFANQVFSNAQNVGIGTNNPTRAKLEVNGAVGATAAIFGGESSGISLQRNWPGIGFNQYYNGVSRYMANGYAAVQFLDPNSGYMALDMFGNGAANGSVNGGQRVMIITNEGRVNIGSGAWPTAVLQVARNSSINGTAVFMGTQNHSYFNYGSSEHTYIRAGFDGGTVFINDIPNGKVALGQLVGIGTATPVYPLEIRQKNYRGLVLVEEGNFDNWEFSSYYGGLNLVFNGNVKGFFLAGSGAYITVSDKRLKTDIQSLPSLLQKITQLQPVSYEMIHNNPAHKRSIGFLAQDVEKLFPELVTKLPDSTKGYKGITDLHALNYSDFGVLAIKAIQEQQEVIKKQGEAIQTLEMQMQELKKIVGQMQKKEM